MMQMNRREMLKLGSAATLATAVAADAAPGHTDHAPVPRWEIFEVALDGPSTGNPFTEVELTATFMQGHRTVQVDGFYDGAGRYKIRFMPDTEGAWKYATAGSAKVLDGLTGGFRCTAALPGSHGPVQVRNTQHFAYADGTPYFPFGTTCYAWVHQSEALQQETLATLRSAPFNKIRFCVFPKSYEYNHNEPALYPFERNAAGENDYKRPNPAFYAHLEERIGDLRAMGIEADLILFHPYDRWGFATMTAEADDRYLRYVVARLSPYRNIWWSLANEFDLMKAKSVGDFDRFFHLVEAHDPVSHLRSVHYSKVMYDYGHPWVTHACLQTVSFENATTWVANLKKPVVFDEVQYEGNLNKRWGNVSGEEMTRRFWLGVVAGCYVSHGETLLSEKDALDENTTPTLWWAHGGKLHGTSVERIGFLRKLVEETAASGGNRTGLDGANDPYYLNASSLDSEGLRVVRILYFMDGHQPIYYEFPLPEGSFEADLIDPWGMTITPVSGRFSGKSKLRLPVKPGQAVRFRRLS